MTAHLHLFNRRFSRLTDHRTIDSHRGDIVQNKRKKDNWQTLAEQVSSSLGDCECEIVDLESLACDGVLDATVGVVAIDSVTRRRHCTGAPRKLSRGWKADSRVQPRPACTARSRLTPFSHGWQGFGCNTSARAGEMIRMIRYRYTYHFMYMLYLFPVK